MKKKLMAAWIVFTVIAGTILAWRVGCSVRKSNVFSFQVYS